MHEEFGHGLLKNGKWKHTLISSRRIVGISESVNETRVFLGLKEAGEPLLITKLEGRGSPETCICCHEISIFVECAFRECGVLERCHVVVKVVLGWTLPNGIVLMMGWESLTLSASELSMRV